MLDYDEEAAHYDETRGGRDRALAAAEAVSGLLPDGAGSVVDVAGGTGSVAAELAAAGRRVAVGDLSMGMLRVAAGRLPGRQLVMDAGRLPFGDASVDAVTSVWLLHLLPRPLVDAVLGEVARVLRPGGRYVTTVDKAAGDAVPPTPAGTMRHHHRRLPHDGREDVGATLSRLDLTEVGSAVFAGGITREGAPEPHYTLVAYEKVGHR